MFHRSSEINIVDSLVEYYDDDFAREVASRLALDAEGVYIIGIPGRPFHEINVEGNGFILVDGRDAINKETLKWDRVIFHIDFRNRTRNEILSEMELLKVAALEGRAPNIEEPPAVLEWIASVFRAVGEVSISVTGSSEARAGESGSLDEEPSMCAWN